MKKDSLLSFVTVIATILLIVLYLQPIIAYDTELGLEIEQRQEEKDKVQRSFNKARQEKEEFDLLTEMERERLLSQVPEKLQQQSIIDDIDGIARKSRANISSINFSNLPDKNNLQRISILTNFTSASQKNTFLDIVRSIERSDRLYTITSISFLLNTAQSNLSLTMESYYKE